MPFSRLAPWLPPCSRTLRASLPCLKKIFSKRWQCCLSLTLASAALQLLIAQLHSVMHSNSRSSATASRASQIKPPVPSISISPSTARPLRDSLYIRNSLLASTSPQILRATAGVKSPLVAFSPAGSSVASAASSRSTQRAPSLDTSLSPPSTRALENISPLPSCSRDITDVRRLRSHALRLEALAAEAQQRLQAETQALKQVGQVVNLHLLWNLAILNHFRNLRTTIRLISSGEHCIR